MSINRLRSRVPSCKVIGAYNLRAHVLRFHKEGMDGSAKCDAWFTGNEEDVVHGVLYDISPDEKIILDNAEGLGNGYSEKNVYLLGSMGGSERAFVYVASKINQSLACFTWYKLHVIIGAIDIKLPEFYIRNIATVPEVIDPVSDRELRELSIYTKVDIAQYIRCVEGLKLPGTT